MNYDIKNVNLKIVDFNTASKNIINSKLYIYNDYLDIKFKIINYLGKGTIGQVYLIEPISGLNKNELYAVKISNSDCQEDLEKEINKVKKYFGEGKIVHKAYPHYFGEFDNINANGAIYPYLGFYNLDKIKSIKYKISWIHNVEIIKQLLNQVNSFKNIIHGDLKPPNVVIDVKDNYPQVTIVDFGLIKKKSDKFGIISTNYVSSPESVLSLKEYLTFKESYESIDYSKHDYFGLYCIIVNLFVKHSYWNVLSKYMYDVCAVNNDYLLEHKAVLLFIYAWYKFFYNSIEEVPSKSMQNLLLYIEKAKIIKNKINNFVKFDEFFNNYIVKELVPETFNLKKKEEFKDFLINLIHFDSSKRADLNTLLTHKFLEN